MNDELNHIKVAIVSVIHNCLKKKTVLPATLHKKFLKVRDTIKKWLGSQIWWVHINCTLGPHHNTNQMRFVTFIHPQNDIVSEDQV